MTPTHLLLVPVASVVVMVHDPNGDAIHLGVFFEWHHHLGCQYLHLRTEHTHPDVLRDGELVSIVGNDTDGWFGSVIVNGHCTLLCGLFKRMYVYNIL